ELPRARVTMIRAPKSCGFRSLVLASVRPPTGCGAVENRSERNAGLGGGRTLSLEAARFVPTRRATASSGRATTARRTPPTSAAPTRSRASASPHWPGSRAGCWRRCAATRRRRCSAPAWTAPPARVPGGWRTDAGPGAHERQGALLGPGPRQRETGRWRWRTSASSSGWSPTARRRRGRLGGPGRCCAGGGPAGAPSRRPPPRPQPRWGPVGAARREVGPRGLAGRPAARSRGAGLGRRARPR
ncbi:unnamed protein product, partial [Prorocentrum cordatum]